MIAQVAIIAKREPNFVERKVCGIVHQAGVGVVLTCTCSENIPGVWWAEVQSLLSPSAMYFMSFTFQIYVQNTSLQDFLLTI